MRPDFTALREAVSGQLLTAYDPGFEPARVLFNTRVRTRPAAILRCAGTADVVEAVRFAGDQGLPFSVKGGGHNASGLCLVQDGLVIDTSAMRSLTTDPAGDPPTVTVGPGLGWRDIDRVTYVEHGLAAPGGECPTVSNAGYTLGGGYGPLTRRFGLGLDHLVAAEVVTADGIVRTSQDEHPDLFWAIRGAGGAGFGVVTELTYRLNPVPRALLTGLRAWPIAKGREVFRAYRDLYLDNDDDKLALCLLLSTDPYPDGEPAISVYGLYAGPVAEGEAALAPLRAIDDPLYDAFEPTSYLDFGEALGAEIPYGLQSKWRGGYFRNEAFHEPAFDTMLEYFATAPSPFSMVRFDLLGGGAVARVPFDATAFAHRGSTHYVSLISLWQEDADTPENVDWVDRFCEDLRPALTGEVYQNYADKDLADWPTAYYGAHYPRLREVKRRYDPHNVFRHGQSIAVDR
jgi:FAD/FMN-containing dehydrogenase